MTVQFPASPATAILHVRRGEYWIGDRIEIEVVEGPGDYSPPWVLLVKGMGDERSFPVRSWIEVVDGIWAGELWTDDGSVGPSFDVRPTMPTDAAVAVSFTGLPRMPLPLDVISYYHRSDGTFSEYRLHALTDDEGFVVTLLLSAPTGLYVRYSSMWHPVTDNTAIENLNVHEVEAGAVDLFDGHERRDRLPNITEIQS